MFALIMCAATNNPHAPPAKASPTRSMTWAHLLTAERVSHFAGRFIICATYQKI
jgi:hypothetical protein